eukprot:1192611-Prorocentrum_minimum.AAC.2
MSVGQKGGANCQKISHLKNRHLTCLRCSSFPLAFLEEGFELVHHLPTLPKAKEYARITGNESYLPTVPKAKEYARITGGSSDDEQLNVQVQVYQSESESRSTESSFKS